MPYDWTTVLDDCMTMRFPHCLLCRQPIDRIDLCWLRDGSGFAMALPLCARCVHADPTEARRHALVDDHARRARQS